MACWVMWVSYFTALCLSFLIGKMGVAMVPIASALRSTAAELSGTVILCVARHEQGLKVTQAQKGLRDCVSIWIVTVPGTPHNGKAAPPPAICASLVKPASAP